MHLSSSGPSGVQGGISPRVDTRRAGLRAAQGSAALPCPWKLSPLLVLLVTCIGGALVPLGGGPGRVREAGWGPLLVPSAGKQPAGCQGCLRPACPAGEEGRVPGRQEDWPQLQNWSENLLISWLH